MNSLNVGALRRSRTRLIHSRDYVQAILETVREPFLVLDGDLRIKTVNRSFYKTFQVLPKKTMNRLIYNLGDGQWQIPRLRELLDQIISTNSDFLDFEVDHEFPGIGRKTMLLNARRIHRKGTSKPLIFLAIEDITARRQAEEKLKKLSKSLKKQSITDELTGLYNRRGFSVLGEHYLKVARQTKKQVSLFSADLNGLKRINDRLGHAEGDRVLMKTADVLKATFRKSDIIARIGGDEFAVIVTGLHEDRAALLISRLQDNLKRSSARNNDGYRLSMSVGEARSERNDLLSLEELTAQADALMYEDKQKRKKWSKPKTLKTR